jgi:hypothetical protein
MILFWIVPYSLMGAKWPRYLLSLMPFVYMSAAVGIVLLIRWAASAFAKWNYAWLVSGAVTGLYCWQQWSCRRLTAYASAPHLRLVFKHIGNRYTAHTFSARRVLR